MADTAWTAAETEPTAARAETAAWEAMEAGVVMGGSPAAMRGTMEERVATEDDREAAARMADSPAFRAAEAWAGTAAEGKMAEAEGETER